MVTEAAETAEPEAASAVRERRPFAIFASAEDFERRRRASDIATFVAAALVVVGSVRQTQHPTELGLTLARLLHDLPGWSKTLMGGAFAIATLYAAFLLVVTFVARDRRGLARDLIVAVGARRCTSHVPSFIPTNRRTERDRADAADAKAHVSALHATRRTRESELHDLLKVRPRSSAW